MTEKIYLDKIPRIKKIENELCVVKREDGKSYLCKLIDSNGFSKEGYSPSPITEQEKQNVRNGLVAKLNKAALDSGEGADLIYEVDTINGKNNFNSENTSIHEYTVYAYKILESVFGQS